MKGSIMELLKEEGKIKDDKMSKVYGFMHICTANQWKDIVVDQLRKIKDSGLYERVDTIFLGIVGDGNIDFIYNLQLDKFKIAYVHHDIAQFEFLTLEFLQDFCKRNLDAKVFYIHTKGISTYGKVCNPPSPERQKNIDDWRRYLEHYIIYLHDVCIKALELADLVGVNWRGKGTGAKVTPQVDSHFSGNFWWAKARYIASLDGVREGDQKRCNAEFWVGKGNGIVASLHESQVDHYRQEYSLKNYEGQVEPVYFEVDSGMSKKL